MDITKYTFEEQSLLAFTLRKVEDFFRRFPAPAHGLDHSLRVAEHVQLIAGAEHARQPVLCLLAAYLHDIGRVPEYFEKKEKRHHELSYELLQQWFREDPGFVSLTNEEKIEILYAVRYHWNDAADDYDTAWILRDADKLDMFGEIGVRRSIEFHQNDSGKIMHDMRFKFHAAAELKTEAAKQIFHEKNLFRPVETYYRQQLREKIEPIHL